jgi:hypothetical protein
MAKVLVGRDATVFTVQGAGVDTQGSGVAHSPGVQYNYIGKWKSIEVEIQNDIEEVTPSSGELKEKRRTTWDWNATLEGQVRQDGSLFLLLGKAHDYVIVRFTEASTGAQIVMYGGIDRSRYRGDKGERQETLAITNMGTYNGGHSILYDGNPLQG